MSTRSILIVDDDESIRETLHDLLVLQGFGVKTAENGRQALEILQAEGDDVCAIILDLPDADTTIRVRCDQNRIQQVLDNLLQNAAKYSPEDRPITLAVATERAHERCIRVTDQGAGISAEDLSSVFLPFFRARSTAVLHKPGLGLGLYIAQQIVRLHGGQLAVTSEPEVGSTFSFCLPTIA